MASNNRNLYSKNILVCMTNAMTAENTGSNHHHSNSRFKQVHITVDYQTHITPIQKTELIIKITDEHDPFFLYTLYMGEDDFQTLKTQQLLLVDFNQFGQRFVDLLNYCEKDERLENPKYQLQFHQTRGDSSYEMLSGGVACLNVVELNPFKHLNHLSLTFTPGNDADVKKYMATCWQTLKEEHLKLKRLFDETQFDLTHRLEKTQEMLALKSQELDKLRLDYDSQSERILAKHMQEMTFEREKFIQNQHSIQQKLEKEKKELEVASAKLTKQLEARIADLDQANKELTDKKFKLEGGLQELRSKYGALQDEFGHLKEELSNVRKQNTSLDTKVYEAEKTINHLRTAHNVLEVEHKTKIELVARTEELLANEQAARKQIEEILKEKNIELKRKQVEIHHFHREFNRGNEEMIKLQNQKKELCTKLSQKSQMISKLEKNVADKEKEIEVLKSDLQGMKSKMSSLSDETRDLKATLQKRTADLDEVHLSLKKSEEMINWLNKQLNEKTSSSASHHHNNSYNNNTTTNNANNLMDTNGDHSTNVHFKPTGKLSNNGGGGAFAQFTKTTTTTNNGGDISSLSASNNSRPYQYTTNHRYLSDQENLDSLTNRTAMSSGTGTAATISNNLPPTTSISAAASARLDPKYFQTSSSPPLVGGLFDQQSTKATNSSSSQQQQQQQRIGLNGLITNNSIDSSSSVATIKPLNNSAKPNLLTASIAVNNNLNNNQQLNQSNGLGSARLNKQLINQPTTLLGHQQQPQTQYMPSTGSALPYAALISSKSTPTIASSYFPQN